MTSKLLIGTIAFIALLSKGLAQNFEATLPYSIQFHIPKVDYFINMPEYDFSKMVVEDKARIVRNEKRFRFAKKFPVDLNAYQDGEWIEMPNGGKLWRIGIRSVKAHSLYFVLSDFDLKPGVRIFAYNSSYSDWQGPLTESDNNKNSIAVIPPVIGNEIIIELNADPGVDHFGNFTIDEIWHDYRNVMDKSRFKSGIFESGSCNVDINCETGEPWQTEKRSVCKLIANGELCTGSLINNVSNEKIPYLITAYHCIEDSLIAAKSIYYFDYEKPYCSAPTTNVSKIVSGAELKATTPNQLDFTLVKLKRFPPISNGIYLAGWDARGYAPSSGVCIHHPSGDVKKISTTSYPLTTASFGEGFNNDSHWLVSRWNIGTTEGGSSGAPVFNIEHRLVGTLTGGDANCDNSVNDYFTKFSLDWDYYPDSTKQLKHWLDPENTGIKSIAGIAPFGLYTKNCDTLSNILKNEQTIVSTANYQWGYLSGQNSMGDAAFAEKFSIESTIDLPGIFLYPAISEGGNAFSYITVKIWKGTDVPQEEVYSKVYFLKNIEDYNQNFIGFDSIIHLNGTFFIGYSVNYQTPADIFAVYHAQNRYSGTSTMYINRNGSWYNSKDITPFYFTSLAISFTACVPVLERETDQLIFGPNPGSDVIIFTSPEAGEFKDIECFNIIGKKQFLELDITINQLMVNVRTLENGIYIIRFSQAGKRYTKKFMVIHSL